MLVEVAMPMPVLVQMWVLVSLEVPVLEEIQEGATMHTLVVAAAQVLMWQLVDLEVLKSVVMSEEM
jgi:hypothetical protein